MTGPSRKLAIAVERLYAGVAPAEAARRAAGREDEGEPTGASDARLAAVARAEYAARRRRDRLFDADIFAEPAWDMLLDLFIQRHQERPVSVNSLCVAAVVPQTTALRWIGKLAGNGLIDRRPCPHDNRVINITLSETGLAVMIRYLRSQLGESDVGSAPTLPLQLTHQADRSMRSYEIRAIRAWQHDPDRLIDGLLIEGTVWPIETVIDWVRNGPHSFWVQTKDCRVRVIAARHWTSGRWFLTTEGQGFPPRTLLALRHVN